MNFLAVTSDYFNKPILQELGLTETLLFGLQMLALGMLAVFAILGIIFALLSIFKLIFKTGDANPKTVPVKEETVIVPTQSKSTDEEIVAVIAAAIAAAESEQNGIKFRVVSFRRK